MSRSGPAGSAKRQPEAAGSADEVVTTQRFRRARFFIPVLFLAAMLAAGWQQVSSIDLLRVRDVLHLIPPGPVHWPSWQ